MVENTLHEIEKLAAAAALVKSPEDLHVILAQIRLLALRGAVPVPEKSSDEENGKSWTSDGPWLEQTMGYEPGSHPLAAGS